MAMHSLTKSGIFFSVGHIAQVKGTQRIADIRGLTVTHPILGWALVVGVMAFVGWRSFATASTLFATYLSHLPADYITGRKPLVPGAPLLGLGLYDRPRWDFAVELIVILVGWLLWRTSLLRERRNRPAAWMLLAGLIAIQAAADFAFSIRNANARIF